MSVTQQDPFTIALGNARGAACHRALAAARAFEITPDNLPTLDDLDGPGQPDAWLAGHLFTAAFRGACQRAGLNPRDSVVKEFGETAFAEAYEASFGAVLTAEATRLAAAADAPPDAWFADEEGITPYQDPGGDIQVTDGFTVRYRRADLPGAIITEYVYGVEYDQCPGEYVVQVQTEFVVCTDPTDPTNTTLWSTVMYQDQGDIYETAAEAEAAALDLAASLLANGGADHSWDGNPFTEGDTE